MKIVRMAAMLAVAIALVAGPGVAPGDAAGLKVVSESTVTGLPFPESVGCDPAGKALYVSQFVSALKPAEKDGKGRIGRLSATGQVLDETFLPVAGQVLHKPKGIWIAGDRLWVTDIDVVWVFDLKTRRGRAVALPGAQFANDPTVIGTVLYVGDNRADQMFRVEPADFLDAAAPKATVVFVGREINPNGVFPGRDGSLLIGGFLSDKVARGIYAMDAGGGTSALTPAIGRIDGLHQMEDGSLLATDWNTGSLFHWSATSGVTPLATGFKGPADFCAMPDAGGLLVAVPDLVKSELRLIRLGR